MPDEPTVPLSYQDGAYVPLAPTARAPKMALRSRAAKGEHVQSAYAVWIGQPVVLQVAAADLRVPLRGMIVGETDDVIRFRVEQAWDIDIYKSMILAVEQDQWARILVN